MKPSIIAKLTSLQERYEKIKILLSKAEVINDQKRFRTLSKEYGRLNNINEHFLHWQQIHEDIITAEQMLEDPETKDMAQDELNKWRIVQIDLEQQLQLLLIPPDSDDERGCFLEIRAGAGGDEAAIFAGNLFRMYSRYIETRCWHMEIISASYSEQGGYKEIVAKISDYGAYGTFKFESGGHRVQRIPLTETQGRIHTSACTVAVLPEVPEAEFPEINATDLRIDTFRSSGAGGQHVNTTESAIRIKHLPTGLVVECQDERSQHKNKAKAMSVLCARIRTAEKHRVHQEMSSTRRNLLGSGDRSDRIRTYNFHHGRVTDHRISLTVYRLDEVMEGKLDILIQPIINEYQADQLTLLLDGKS